MLEVDIRAVREQSQAMSRLMRFQRRQEIKDEFIKNERARDQVKREEVSDFYSAERGEIGSSAEERETSLSDAESEPSASIHHSSRLRRISNSIPVIALEDNNKLRPSPPASDRPSGSRRPVLQSGLAESGTQSAPVGRGRVPAPPAAKARPNEQRPISLRHLESKFFHSQPVTSKTLATHTRLSDGSVRSLDDLPKLVAQLEKDGKLRQDRTKENEAAAATAAAAAGASTTADSLPPRTVCMRELPVFTEEELMAMPDIDFGDTKHRHHCQREVTGSTMATHDDIDECSSEDSSSSEESGGSSALHTHSSYADISDEEESHLSVCGSGVSAVKSLPRRSPATRKRTLSRVIADASVLDAYFPERVHCMDELPPVHQWMSGIDPGELEELLPHYTKQDCIRISKHLPPLSKPKI